MTQRTSLRPQLTFGLILAVVAVGMVRIAQYHWREGTVIIGGALLLAAGLRAILPPERTGLLGIRRRTFDVFTYKPANYKDGPLIVVFHGVLRNADTYRDNAKKLADRHGALVVAPRFDEKQFPSAKYQQGGLLKNVPVWPKADPKLAAKEELEIPVQVNGKLRSRVIVAPDISETDLRTIALADGKVRSFIDGHEVVKVIVVPQRLVNVVVK